MKAYIFNFVIFNNLFNGSMSRETDDNSTVPKEGDLLGLGSLPPSPKGSRPKVDPFAADEARRAAIEKEMRETFALLDLFCSRPIAHPVRFRDCAITYMTRRNTFTRELLRSYYDCWPTVYSYYIGGWSRSTYTAFSKWIQEKGYMDDPVVVGEYLRPGGEYEKLKKSLECIAAARKVRTPTYCSRPGCANILPERSTNQECKACISQVEQERLEKLRKDAVAREKVRQERVARERAADFSSFIGTAGVRCLAAEGCGYSVSLDSSGRAPPCALCKFYFSNGQCTRCSTHPPQSGSWFCVGCSTRLGFC